MKKNSDVSPLPTGAMRQRVGGRGGQDEPSRVEKIEAISEFSRYGAMSRSKTARYWSRVGVKNKVGGLVEASRLLLEAGEEHPEHREEEEQPDHPGEDAEHDAARDACPPRRRLGRGTAVSGASVRHHAHASS